MMQRLHDIPVYSTLETQVPAEYYNRIKLTTLRLGGAVRFGLKGFQYVDVIIDNDSWVCVDTSLDDLPMVAWVDFNVRGRDNLYQPITCTLNYYHYMSGLIARDALPNIDAHLLCQLDEWLQYDMNTPKKRHKKHAKGHLSLV